MDVLEQIIERESYSSEDRARSFNTIWDKEKINKNCNIIEDLVKELRTKSLEILEENEILKKRSDDDIFKDKIRAIDELNKEAQIRRRQMWEMLTLEEVENVGNWFAQHVLSNPNQEHKLKCHMYYGPLGYSRDVECSCHATYNLGDSDKW